MSQRSFVFTENCFAIILSCQQKTSTHRNGMFIIMDVIERNFSEKKTLFSQGERLMKINYY